MRLFAGSTGKDGEEDIEGIKGGQGMMKARGFGAEKRWGGMGLEGREGRTARYLRKKVEDGL